MHAQLPRCALVLTFVATAACQSTAKTDGTPGEKGIVEFSYQSGCFFGCALEQPLLSGTHQQIQLSEPGDVEGLSVTSSDEQVVQFNVERACFCERSDSTRHVDIALDARCDAPWQKHCDNRVQVTAGEAGDAWLELKTAQASELDRVQVLVRDANKAEFAAILPDHAGATAGSNFEATNGASLDLAATLYDDQGRKLLAPDGVKWRSSDASVATLSAWLSGSGAEISSGLTVSVQFKAAGSVEVGLTVPGLDADAAHVMLDVKP